MYDIFCSSNERQVIEAATCHYKSFIILMSGSLKSGLSFQTDRCLPAGDRVRVCIAILRVHVGAPLSASCLLNALYLRSLFYWYFPDSKHNWEFYPCDSKILWMNVSLIQKSSVPPCFTVFEGQESSVVFGACNFILHFLKINFCHWKTKQ